MSKRQTYQESIDELENIVDAIENEDIGIDELSEKVKKAASLLKFCQKKLRKTESDIDAILGDMDTEDKV